MISFHILVLLPALLPVFVFPHTDHHGHAYPHAHYHGECSTSNDCAYHLACTNTYCQDPCIGAFGTAARCKVRKAVLSVALLSQACPLGCEQILLPVPVQ